MERCRGALGISVNGDSVERVRARARTLGIATEHLPAGRPSNAPSRSQAPRRPRPSWTDDQLIAAVELSGSWTEVCRALSSSDGIVARGPVQRRARELGLSTDHFYDAAWRRRTGVDGVIRKRWTDEQLADAVRASRSIAGVIRALGLRVGGSQDAAVGRRIDALGLDTSHFHGQGWARGQRLGSPPSAMPLEAILVEGSSHSNTHSLKRRLVAAGLLEARCAECGITQWQGRPAPLQLDHVNGDRHDNRLHNLRLLCPNCHALTDTWCGRNIRRGR